MKPIFSLLFLSLELLFLLRPAAARGGADGGQSSNTSGFVDSRYMGSARHLFEDNKFQILEKKAQGYMTNAELENAIKAFGDRCRSISRIYSG
ncbi:hypothetical protein RJ639_000629 [Escallonia herrerae]|uniref:Uncharacterized protein n=1 Tax=Escallonia herrerae TaxID=1293975 RepID=A0AA88XK77_9ASTE|nr:hypothetical protein RJ639_000629 [Escallonia herrerae]